MSLVKFFSSMGRSSTSRFRAVRRPCDASSTRPASPTGRACPCGGGVLLRRIDGCTTSASVTIANNADHSDRGRVGGERLRSARLSGSVRWTALPGDQHSVVTWVYFFLDGALYHAEQHAPYGAVRHLQLRHDEPSRRAAHLHRARLWAERLRRRGLGGPQCCERQRRERHPATVPAPATKNSHRQEIPLARLILRSSFNKSDARRRTYGDRPVRLWGEEQTSEAIAASR